MEQLQRFIEERYQQICQFERKMEQLKNQLAQSELHRGRMDPKGSNESIDFSKSILKAMMSCKRNEQYRIRMEEQLIADLENQAIPISKDSQNFLSSSVQAMKSIDAGFVGTSTSDDINKCTAETYKLFFAKQQEARKYNETRAMQQASLLDQDAAKVKLLKWLTQASRVNFERTLYKRSQQAFSSIIQKSKQNNSLDKNLAQYILRNQHGLSYSCNNDTNNSSPNQPNQQQQLIKSNNDNTNNITSMFLPLDPPLGKRIITFKQATVENTFKSQLKVTGTNQQSIQSMGQNNSSNDKQAPYLNIKSSLTSTFVSERQSPTNKRQNSGKLHNLSISKDQSKQVKLQQQSQVLNTSNNQQNIFRYDINYQKRLAAVPSDKKYGKILQGGQILDTRRLLDVEAMNRGNPNYSILARRHSDADSITVAKNMLFNQLSSSNQMIRNTREAYYRSFLIKFPAKNNNNSNKEIQNNIYSSMPQLDKRIISQSNLEDQSSLNCSIQSQSNKLNVCEQLCLLQNNRTQLKESIDLNAVPIRKLVKSPYLDSLSPTQRQQESQQQLNLSSVYGSFRGRKQESSTKGSSQQNSLNLSIYPLNSIEDDKQTTQKLLLDDDSYENQHYSVSKRLINFSLKKRRESWKDAKFSEFQKKYYQDKQLGETSSQKKEQQALLSCYDEIPTNQTLLTQISTIIPIEQQKIMKNGQLSENQSTMQCHSAYNSCNVSIDSNSNMIDRSSIDERRSQGEGEEEITVKYSQNLRSRSLFQNKQLQMLKKQIAKGCRQNINESAVIGLVVGKGVVQTGNNEQQQLILSQNPLEGKIQFGKDRLERKLSLKDYYFPQSATKESKYQYQQQLSDERRSFHAAAVAPFKMNVESKEINIAESLQKKFILNISRQCSERKNDYSQRRKSIYNNRYLEPIVATQQLHHRSSSEQK